ncbi:MarR family winged helix-turn-helix transcriptional regulator [Psychrobacillus sp. NPDC096426]|uniref:MarR family winged helix-turn-helix transcriptional regulator n=1 Tax=Psychrobacillus sp. NPDC096426 TaxID=3364491 RepID=UPI00381D2A95
MFDKPFNRETSTDTKYSTSLWFSLVRVHKKNTTGTTQLLKGWNLTNAQMDIISRIAESGQLSQQDLADKLLVTKGNITQLLKKLEQINLVKKEKDWKTNHISLTEEGLKIYEQLTPVLEEFQTDYFQKLSTDEKKQLLNLIRKIES